jgi:hypothetical protein
VVRVYAFAGENTREIQKKLKKVRDGSNLAAVDR